ncbi:hypothetical protein BEWA_004810 [Theileria equi strain WA]|uniref:Uncharacterized protein n=1 Tax=Theileria equi strain WA TaxID=1537102 RepID=L0B0N8_THEEQ|nr:hypothetical protein BEWA_004810 [Theileria equi strain WA]AFZ81073.1 hypothetical protein BEWA_004810 [Theileria equi strain WA]|eukprot:XP_004830739.1 hypothetical protein BEWA_004810 [Theileria equi strain WA]
MPRHPSLFGKYIRLNGFVQRKGFKKTQVIHPIPVKAYGRVPSASSQTGLYHDEDYNYYTKVAYSLQKTRIKLKPNVFKKDFESHMLNTTVPNVRVTTSALHAITEEGGFDNYILNTTPEQLRSQLGERLRSVFYFYKQNPEFRKLQMPWKIYYSEMSKKDPMFAVYKHLLGKEKSEKKQAREYRRFSPFYLPPANDLIPECQNFANSQVKDNLKLNLWWKGDKEKEFRARLGEARTFDAAHVDINLLNAYRKGEGRGGGGPHGKSLRKRSKTFNFNQGRPY